MTVASSTSKAGPYAGNGVTMAFAFGFSTQQAADINVVSTVLTGGVYTDTTLTQGVDYTVSLNADQVASPGGSVTATVAPATGAQITVLRNVTSTQGASLPNQGGFYPKVIENALDKLTMLVQQLFIESARSIKVSVADSITNLHDLLASIAASVTAASGSASSASTSATTATTQAGVATTQVGLATTQATNAATSAQLANDWAQKTGSTVDGSGYSSKYWAQYAASILTGELIYMGVWDASSGAYPGAPVKGAFWKVSVAGTVSGTAYYVSDDIIYNGTGWDKVDNQQTSRGRLLFFAGA